MFDPKRGLGAAIVLTLAVAAAGTASAQSKRFPSDVASTGASKMPVVHEGGLKFGAYDPHGDFGDATKAAIEHIFLPWQDVDLSSLAKADTYARARGRELLVTVEPWSWSEDSSTSPNELRDGIARGRYDGNIDAVCGRLARMSRPVTIRFAHEMDDPSGQFPWSQWRPADYVAAYRHFVDRCRASMEGARYMWSPLGQRNLGDYYPGDAYVDVVGLSVFGLQRFDNDKFGRDLSFAEILRPKYQAAKPFKKPIVVAELGYLGNEQYLAKWADDVTRPQPEFPDLVAVVYFNDMEVYPWPGNYGLPNWRVAKPSRGFVRLN